mmetsp:Transcript_8024/g.20054  ORF Transcript_8024/g.20054 Transcript_8024/m.20054 type:complete len:1197 (-) Transcript_8024:602-4192(-)
MRGVGVVVDDNDKHHNNPGLSNKNTDNGNNNNNHDNFHNRNGTMSSSSSLADPTSVLTQRLVNFRTWLKEEVGAQVHPSVCIVNGSASDGTKNAPILTVGGRTNHQHRSGGGGGGGAVADNTLLTGGEQDASNGGGGDTKRLGSIDEMDSLYTKTTGCQVRAVREIKAGNAILTLPKAGMITPDVVARSDAGRAILACVASNPKNSDEGTTTTTTTTPPPPPHFWDAFGNTTELVQLGNPKIAHNSGMQLLVKILRERSDAQKAVAARQLLGTAGNDGPGFVLAPRGAISTRAPLLAFLIHQRFHPSPDVVGNSPQSKEQFQSLLQQRDSDESRNALQESTASTTTTAPHSFAPYSLTWPSVVMIPLCWTRSELALLNGCIPGNAILQEVALETMHLATEFQLLLQAGILERFPATFPPGLVTFDRWVWAASIVTSRTLPATAYFHATDVNSSTFAPRDSSEELQSPGPVWDELGVMIPLLDMLNHEINNNQVKWESTASSTTTGSNNNDSASQENHVPRAVLEKKVKKGNEIFTAYGYIDNHRLICQYGIAQVNNPKDEIRIGWGLAESVGGAAFPEDFKSLVVTTAEDIDNNDVNYQVCDRSNDPELVEQWWTEERMILLQREALSSNGNAEAEAMVANLKQGRKLISYVCNDGSLNPVLLSTIVVATAPPAQVTQRLHATTEEVVTRGNGGDDRGEFVICPRHLKSFRTSLADFLARKLEKLLKNLDSGLKAHYANCQLWTKAANGGLNYDSSAKETSGEPTNAATGWCTFYNQNGFESIMEVEKNAYYAMAPDSCVLTLYDGQLRALQSSLNAITNEDIFRSDVAKQLQNLGYRLLSKDDVHSAADQGKCSGKTETKASNSKTNKADTAECKLGDEKDSPGRRRRNRKRKNGSAATPTGGSTGAASNSDRNIYNNNTGSNKPPALKLHVGNLAYTTTPSDLYDFFCILYGKGNILECHIPVERETGRSRGFGFVTMPEPIAQTVLSSGRKHEIAGRLLKVARSNSAGTNDSSLNSRVMMTQSQQGGNNHNNHSGGHSRDRCGTCGYRPRYCSCPSFVPRDGDRRNFPRFEQQQQNPRDIGPPPRGDRVGYDDPPSFNWKRGGEGPEGGYRDDRRNMDRYGRCYNPHDPERRGHGDNTFGPKDGNHDYHRRNDWRQRSPSYDDDVRLDRKRRSSRDRSRSPRSRQGPGLPTRK